MKKSWRQTLSRKQRAWLDRLADHMAAYPDGISIALADAILQREPSLRDEIFHHHSAYGMDLFDICSWIWKELERRGIQTYDPYTDEILIVGLPFNIPMTLCHKKKSRSLRRIWQRGY